MMKVMTAFLEKHMPEQFPQGLNKIEEDTRPVLTPEAAKLADPYISMATGEPLPPMENGVPAYFWVLEGGETRLYRGIVIEENVGVVRIHSSREFNLPRAEVYPTFIDAVEGGYAKGYRMPERRKAPPPKITETWLCSGCKGREETHAGDRRVVINRHLTLRGVKCKKCKDEMVLVRSGPEGELHEGDQAAAGAVRAEGGVDPRD